MIIEPPETILVLYNFCLCGVSSWKLLRLWKIGTYLFLLVLLCNGSNNRCGGLVESAFFEITAIFRHVHIILIEFWTRLSRTVAVMRIVFVLIDIQLAVLYISKRFVISIFPNNLNRIIILFHNIDLLVRYVVILFLVLIIEYDDTASVQILTNKILRLMRIFILLLSILLHGHFTLINI